MKTKTTSPRELTATRRAAVGTRPVRRLRGEGFVPGIVYGKDTTPFPIAVKSRELAKLLHATTGEHALVTLRMEDPPPWQKPVLVKSVQHDPVDDAIIHVDFHAIVLTERLRVRVPILLTGEPVGVKQDGGILEHFLRDIEVECLPTEIPASVAFDVSALKIGETVHVRDLIPPRNARITADPEGAIASVQKPKEEKPEEAAAAVTEPEVIREKKEETAPAGEAAAGESAEPKKDAKT